MPVGGERKGEAAVVEVEEELGWVCSEWNCERQEHWRRKKMKKMKKKRRRTMREVDTCS